MPIDTSAALQADWVVTGGGSILEKLVDSITAPFKSDTALTSDEAMYCAFSFFAIGWAVKARMPQTKIPGLG